LGAPSGAFGGSNGVQSGSESLMSTLIVPLNGSLTTAPSGCRPVIGWPIRRLDVGSLAHSGWQHITRDGWFGSAGRAGRGCVRYDP